MNWQEALTQRLLDDAGVTAIVGTRVRWDRVDQDDVPPYAILTVISDPRPRHMEGGQGFRPSLVQMAFYHDVSRTAAITLRDAAIDALAPGGVFDGRRFDPLRIDDVRSDYEQPSGGGEIWREDVDVSLFHD